MRGTCKLCGQEGELHKRSHVFPEFMYQDIFDEKHRIIPARFKDGNIKTSRPVQTGAYDSDLYCKSCEHIVFGQFDRYASLILYDGYEKEFKHGEEHGKYQYLRVGGLEYKKFKLFLLSLLYRASQSKHETFKEVNLGPYEERIGRMILDGDPGPPDRFPTLILSYLHIDDLPIELVTPPNRARSADGSVYSFAIGGMIYSFFLRKKSFPAGLEDAVLNEQCELRIIFATEGLAKKALSALLGMRIP